MFSLKNLAILAFAAFVAVHAEVEEEDDVLVLTDANFEEVVLAHDMLLVEFYAPWCGHCKSLAPEYAKAAKALKANNPPLRLAKLDATAHTKAAEGFKVQGFPTLKLLKGSINPEEAKDFDGGRSADEIEKWMIKKSGPLVKIIQTVEELESLTQANEVVVVAVIDNVNGPNKAIMEKVAGADDFSIYVATENAEIAKKYSMGVGSVILLKQFDEGVNTHSGAFEVEAIKTFVNANNKPLIITFSQEKAPQIFGGDVQVHVLLFSDESDDYHADLVAGATVAATANKGKLLHIFVPSSEDRILDYFGLEESALPAIVLVNMASGMKKFSFPKNSDDLKADLKDGFSDELVKFENDYFDGNLTPTLKSAEPVDDTDEAVKIIVGKQFQERVIDSGKDVLLEFYAPWCGHCKNLAPKYEELAEKFSGVDSIMIAKIDSTENEVDYPGVNVQGFPTILFFSGGKVTTYEGSRDVDGFTEFLKQNARKFEFDGESHGVSHDEL